jgi:hypothetical protein
VIATTAQLASIAPEQAPRILLHVPLVTTIQRKVVPRYLPASYVQLLGPAQTLELLFFPSDALRDITAPAIPSTSTPTLARKARIRIATISQHRPNVSLALQERRALQLQEDSISLNLAWFVFCSCDSCPPRFLGISCTL